MSLFDLTFDLGNEGGATGGQRAKALHGISLRVVVGDDQNLSIVLEAVGGPLDEVVCRFVGLGIKHLDLPGIGLLRSRTLASALAIKEHRDGCTQSCLVFSEGCDEGFPGPGRMAGRFSGQFGPGVQETVAIYKNADQRHGGDSPAMAELPAFLT